MEQNLLVDIIKSWYNLEKMRQIYQSFTSREEICLLKEKIVKKSSIQTRLDQVYQQIWFDSTPKLFIWHK